MTTASKQAYEDILPRVGTIKRHVLEAIKTVRLKGWYADIPRIQFELETQGVNIGYSTLTARLSDLYDDGLIVEVDSNSKYSVWNLASPEIRSQVKKLRRIEKYKAWKKKGEEFKDLIEAGL